jgi:RecB family exonuclease
LPSKPAPALYFGNAIHSCLEFLHRPDGGEASGRTLADLLDYLDQRWAPPEELTESLMEEARCGRDRAEMLLTEYFLKHVGHDSEAGRTNEPERAYAVEKKFKIAFDGDVVNGIIDRVDRVETADAFQIIDYKTNKKAPKGLYKEQLTQLAVYKWAAEEGTDWEGNPLEFGPVSRAGLFFVVPEENRIIFANEGDLNVKAVKKELRSAIDAIKAATEEYGGGQGRIDAFPAKQNNLCAWCDYKELCNGRA